jgi:hypothetical protein
MREPAVEFLPRSCPAETDNEFSLYRFRMDFWERGWSEGDQAGGALRVQLTAEILR